jgi:hypothetical protein
MGGVAGEEHPAGAVVLDLPGGVAEPGAPGDLPELGVGSSDSLQGVTDLRVGTRSDTEVRRT